MNKEKDTARDWLAVLREEERAGDKILSSGVARVYLPHRLQTRRLASLLRIYLVSHT